SRVDQETGCWEWGMCKSLGLPNVRFTVPGTDMSLCRSCRIAAVVLKTGRLLPPKHFVIPTSKCQNRDCVNPDHCRVVTLKEHRAWLAKSGRLKSVKRRVAATKHARETWGTINMDIARQLRAHPGTAAQAAAALGVSKAIAIKVRAGLTWREAAPGASVFSMVGA
ncbi:MAG: hypothetical protein KIH64_006315, partial [Mycobacterium sp.]|nr:hypothetical protein [Mycobacterium sp.]